MARSIPNPIALQLIAKLSIIASKGSIRRTLTLTSPGSPNLSESSPTSKLAEVGIEASVGSVGDSYDNALAETIIGLYKAEVIYARGPWRTHDAVEYAPLEWVDWFNNRRLLESIGHVPPAEHEREYHRLNEVQAMAA